MTNRLRLYTERSDSPESYVVRWMTGLNTRGIVHVNVPGDVEDGKVAAELAVARWLLEVCNVCGHDKTGTGLILYFSCGAIKKLSRADSAKASLARFARFLRTRFFGAEIEVENRKLDWLVFEAEPVQLDPNSLEYEFLEMRGVGKVDLTAHAVEQYVERFGRKPGRAWRELRLLLIDPKIYEVQIRNRRASSNAPHKTHGRFFYLPSREMIFVVANETGSRPPQVITIYGADEETRMRLYKTRNSLIDLEDLGYDASDNGDSLLGSRDVQTA